MEEAVLLDYDDFEVVDVSEIDWQEKFEETFPLDDELKEAIRLFKAGEGPMPTCLIRKFADDTPRCVIFVDSDSPYNKLPVSN